MLSACASTRTRCVADARSCTCNANDGLVSLPIVLLIGQRLHELARLGPRGAGHLEQAVLAVSTNRHRLRETVERRREVLGVVALEVLGGDAHDLDRRT